MKKKFEVYSDGILQICNLAPKKSGFQAVKNVSSLDDLEILEKLAYAEKSKRDSDVEFAEAMGHKLTIKVKTYLRESVKTNMSVLINKTIYSIYKLDYDRQNNAMYLYLEEMRQL